MAEQRVHSTILIETISEMNAHKLFYKLVHMLQTNLTAHVIQL